MKTSFLNAATVAFLLFLAIVSLGTSLAVIPLYVNDVLQFSPTVVGIVVATESIATLLSRAYAGRFSDSNGPKAAMLRGQSLVLLAGIMFFATYILDSNSNILALLLILASRVIMGIGESLIFTSSGTWTIGLVGREHAGKILSWVGIAMFVGLALGNYAGGKLFYHYSLLLPSLIMWLLPLVAVMIALTIPKVEVHDDVAPIKLSYAIQRIWKAGAGFALANMGYAAITSFLLLFCAQQGWTSQGPLTLALFGIGYVVARVILGGYTDAMGIKSTVASLVIEAIGLILIALATTPTMAMLGSFLTGFGLSMVYPLLALPAIKSLPEKNIGMAISTYESCFDVGILLSGFIGGMLVSTFGFATLFMFTGICSLVAVVCSQAAYKQLAQDQANSY